MTDFVFRRQVVGKKTNLRRVNGYPEVLRRAWDRDEVERRVVSAANSSVKKELKEAETQQSMNLEDNSLR